MFCNALYIFYLQHAMDEFYNFYTIFNLIKDVISKN